MSARLSDIEARLGTVHQLSSVIGAMRGIAAARAREARGRLAGIRAYGSTVGQAIGQALALLPPARPLPPPAADGGCCLVVLCAEQGFVGTYNERVMDVVARLRAPPAPPALVLMAGDRGLMLAQERGIAVDWSAPMIAHADHATRLANRLAEALFDRIAAGAVHRVTMIHAEPVNNEMPRVVARHLVPFDFGRFPLPVTATPPRLTLPAAGLLDRLIEEYVFAELCEAVMLAFAAENEARLRAMIAARAHVADTLEDLTGAARRLRQEQITSEIIELAAGVSAGGVPPTGG